MRSELSFEGHAYPTIEYAGNCWFAENLRYLPFISSETATSNSNPRVYVNGYSGSSIEEAQQLDTYDMYGAYYNYATISTMDVCPSGGVCRTAGPSTEFSQVSNRTPPPGIDENWWYP